MFASAGVLNTNTAVCNGLIVKTDYYEHEAETTCDSTAVCGATEVIYCHIMAAVESLGIGIMK